MAKYLINLIEKSRVQLLLFTASGLLFFKLFLHKPDSMWSIAISDLLVILLFYYMVVNVRYFVVNKSLSPVTLVGSKLVFGAVILLLFNLTKVFVSILPFEEKTLISGGNYFAIIFEFVFALLLLLLLSYIFLVFRELFFLKQKKNLNTYYSALIIFLILSCFSSVWDQYESLRFIRYAFTANVIILIVINSVRISWIAFLTKKQKKSLLLLSVALILLFSFYLAQLSSNGTDIKLMKNFSPSLYHFNMLIGVYAIIYFGFLFFITLFHIPTAEAFDRKATEVSSLQYFSKLINQSLDFNELADTITDLAIKVSNTDAAWIVMAEDESQTPIAIKNTGYISAGKIINYVMSERKNEFISLTVMKLPFPTEGDMAYEKFRFVAVSPVRSHSQISGYLFIAKKSDIPFDDEDKNVIQTFTDYASIAVENSKLLKQSIEKERLEKELDVAREMQNKLLPLEVPQYPELDISAIFIPAFEVGGDYYDFFELDNNKLGFVIADVSGKGISAAFVMAEIRGIFESVTKLIMNPKEVLVMVNNTLKRTLDKNSFVSAIFGIIDRNGSTMTFSRAGHPSLLLIRNNEVKELTPSGCGLGLTYSEIFEDNLHESTFDLVENDLLLLYTDGITEAKNEKMEDFGLQRLKDVIMENKENDTESLSHKIIKEVTLFSESNSQHDDITLLIFKWKRKQTETNNG